jgi:hypothetical protein
MSMHRKRFFLMMMAGVLTTSAWAAAQQQQQSPPTPPSPPAAEPPVAQPEKKPPADEPLPNLDELLGLPGGSSGGAPDPGRSDLDQVLSGAEIGNAFKQAVTLMGDVAKRMQETGDVSLATQRMQETILRRLDQLISSLEQQQNQQQQQQQQSTSQQQSQSNQRVPSQQRTEANQDQKGDNTGQTNNPDRKDGPMRPALDSARASWGNLPDRVREMLVQGSSDRFSSLYDSLTQSYYRRLAEEAKQR